MAENKSPPATTPDSNLNINPPPPSSHSGSQSNAPFTPRSSTFPDGYDSDDDFDTFNPTPVHSPVGPQYEDLPPSYDEAQQQALQDARQGIPPIDPNNLEVHRMVINDQLPSPPAQLDRSGSTSLIDVNEAQYERDSRRNADGLGMNVPIQQVQNSDQIPVGQVPTTAPDPTTVLLNRALEFTRHEPDADVRYAPRLTRCVAIPQEGVPGQSNARRGDQRCRRGRKERGRGPPWARRGEENHRMPGQWPGTESTETVNTTISDAEEPVQFMRTYAKALHAHSIRPAEFSEFLDGLNALCLATNTTPNDLLHTDSNEVSPSSIVRNYIDSVNEAFFAPRGLKVSLQSIATLMNSLKIPEERGQRAGAVASALDSKSTPEQRALALHPWIEKLETDVPSMSTQTLFLRELGERFRRQSFSSARPDVNRDNGVSSSKASEASAAGQDDNDPPHSIPEGPPNSQPQGFPPFPPFGGLPFGRNHPRGPAPWVPTTPWTAPHQGPWGRGRHYGPGHHGPGRGWGGLSSFPWGPPPPHHGPHPHGPHQHPHHGPPGCGPRGPANNWAALGQAFGKWGEEFGKKAQEWGEQIGRDAETWGQDIGRNAQNWGNNVAARSNGTSMPERGQPSNNGQAAPPPPEYAAAAAGPEALIGQETGVHRGDSKAEASTSAQKVKTKKGDDDDDVSSISSDSSSSSDSDSDSDSEDEEDYPDTHALFLERMREINAAAETSRTKGKKSPDEIARERDLAIEQAQNQKTALELKVERKRADRQVKREQKREKRQVKRELRRKNRQLKREHRIVKKELKALNGGKGKDKSAKRQQREEYWAKKREHRKAKEQARREWREKKWERKRLRREGLTRGAGASLGDGLSQEGMVWIVVENLGA